MKTKYIIWGGLGAAAAALIAYFLFFKKTEEEKPLPFSLSKSELDKLKQEFASSNPYAQNTFAGAEFEPPEDFGGMANRLNNIIPFKEDKDKGEELLWALSEYPLTPYKIANRGWLFLPESEMQKIRTGGATAEEEFNKALSANKELAEAVYKANAILGVPPWMPSQLHGRRTDIPRDIFEAKVFSKVRELLQNEPAQTEKILKERFSSAGGLSKLPPNYISTAGAALASQARAEIAALYYYL